MTKKKSKKEFFNSAKQSQVVDCLIMICGWCMPSFPDLSCSVCSWIFRSCQLRVRYQPTQYAEEMVLWSSENMIVSFQWMIIIFHFPQVTNAISGMTAIGGLLLDRSLPGRVIWSSWAGNSLFGYGSKLTCYIVHANSLLHWILLEETILIEQMHKFWALCLFFWCVCMCFCVYMRVVASVCVSISVCWREVWGNEVGREGV